MPSSTKPRIPRNVVIKPKRFDPSDAPEDLKDFGIMPADDETLQDESTTQESDEDDDSSRSSDSSSSSSASTSSGSVSTHSSLSHDKNRNRIKKRNNRQRRARGRTGGELKASELLAYANLRLEQQKLRNQVRALQEIVHKKENQIIHLTTQLKRATASKCDLVVACNELERQQESLRRHVSSDALKERQNYLKGMEERAVIEAGFMNELSSLIAKICDMDRHHKNEMLERDFTIAQLQEKIRRQSHKH